MSTENRQTFKYGSALIRLNEAGCASGRNEGEWRMSRWRPDALSGPISTIIRSRAIARVLDEALIVGNMEQTVSMLSESTRFDYKTVQSALHHLIKCGLVQKTRKIGNAQAYRFKVENELHGLLDWAEEIRCNRKKL
jgi:DNA-binding transcriptional regulator YhcF (GntR family)